MVWLFTPITTEGNPLVGASFDSRNNPYAPKLALDNVLVYGCDLWDFSSQAYDGLEIRYTELIHSSFAVNKDDPTRTKTDFGLYTKGFTGPGSYRAEAHYAASNDSAGYKDDDACSLDVAVDGAGGIKGSFDCTIAAKEGSGSVSVKVRASRSNVPVSRYPPQVVPFSDVCRRPSHVQPTMSGP